MNLKDSSIYQDDSFRIEIKIIPFPRVSLTLGPRLPIDESLRILKLVQLAQLAQLAQLVPLVPLAQFGLLEKICIFAL